MACKHPVELEQKASLFYLLTSCSSEFVEFLNRLFTPPLAILGPFREPQRAGGGKAGEPSPSDVRRSAAARAAAGVRRRLVAARSRRRSGAILHWGALWPEAWQRRHLTGSRDSFTRWSGARHRKQRKFGFRGFKVLEEGHLGAGERARPPGSCAVVGHSSEAS